MKRGLIPIFFWLVIIISITYLLLHTFDPVYETVELEQDIGGELICESVYVVDHHTWEYIIDYSYVNENRDTIKIGQNVLIGQEWEKNEQIQKQGDWYFLEKTDKNLSKKLLVGKLESSNWFLIEASVKEIKEDSTLLEKLITLNDKI